MEHESDSDANCSLRTWYRKHRIVTDIVGLGIKRTNWHHPNYSIVEIGQNTKKSPGDLRRLTVTQTPVEKHQLTLVRKTVKKVK